MEDRVGKGEPHDSPIALQPEAGRADRAELHLLVLVDQKQQNTRHHGISHKIQSKEP